MPRGRYAKSREERMRDRYDQDVNRMGEVGRTLTDHFSEGIQSDPRASFERAVEAAHSMFKRRLGENVRDLRSQQVGMNRLDTGFATEDEDRLFTESAERMHDQIGSRALQAEGLNLDRLAIAGGAGERMSGEAMAARGGEYQTLRQQRLQRESEKRRGRGNLIGSLITGAASVATGPIGDAIADRFIRKKKE